MVAVEEAAVAEKALARKAAAEKAAKPAAKATPAAAKMQCVEGRGGECPFAQTQAAA